MSSTAETTMTPAQSAARAIRNIAIALVILGGLYFAYHRYVQSASRLRDLSKDAFAKTQRDTLKDYQDAKAMLDQGLEINSTDAFAVSARAEVGTILWLEHGLAEEAPRAKALIEVAKDKEFNLAERFSAEGLALVADGKPGDAETFLTDIAQKGGAKPQVVAAIGIAHARLGKLDLARNDFKQASDRDWRSPRFQALFGENYFDLGDFGSAQTTFAKALELNPGHVRSIIGKARADVARNEQVDAAKSALADAAGRTDELSPVLKSRLLAAQSETALSEGDSAVAEQFARDALAIDAAKIDPAYAYGHYDLGLALAKQKKAGALDAFKAAIAHDKLVSRFYFHAAQVLAENGNAADGEALFAEAEKTLEKNDKFFLARGDFYRTNGDYPKALEAYDAAQKANEVNAEGYYKKGLLLQAQAALPKADKRKLFDGAREQYEKAVGIRSKYPEVYRQMGLIYVDVKPTSAEALENFGKALNFYKEQKAPLKTVDEFINEVEQRYLKAGLKANAAAWKKEATAASK